jgi:hypothetical protein
MSLALATIVRRAIRAHGLAAVLDAIADVLQTADDPALGHDAEQVRRLARRVWTRRATDLV